MFAPSVRLSCVTCAIGKSTLSRGCSVVLAGGFALYTIKSSFRIIAVLEPFIKITVVSFIVGQANLFFFTRL